MVENSLVKSKEKATFSTYLTSDAVKKKINDMIGGSDGQRFITSIISAVSANPALADCDHSTILSAAMIGESLKLSPSPQLGQFYIVPFNDNKHGRVVATFQIGYKGYIQLAIRSGQYKKLNVIELKEGELKRYNPLTEEIEVELIEDDELREKTPTIGFYAMFQYLNGFQKTIYWTKKKMEAHALKYSPAFRKDREKGWNNSFWSKDFDSQGKKTMIRQLISKWGIMSIEIQSAFEKDSFETEQEPGYVDNKKPENDFFDATAQVVNETPEPVQETVTPETAQAKENK